MDFLSAMDLGWLAVIIGVLVVGASVLLGWTLFYVMRSREKTDSRRRETSPAMRQPGSPLATTPQGIGKPPADKAKASSREQSTTSQPGDRQASDGPVEVVRLLRDRVTGALIVQVEGEKYRRLGEIKNGQVGRQVLRAAADLVRFTEVIQSQGHVRTASQSSHPATEPSAVVLPPAPSTPTLQAAPALETEPPVPRTPAPPAVEREFLQSLMQQGQPKEEENKKLSISPIEFFRRGFAARRSAGMQSLVPSTRSFVEEIEDILQRFIRTYPSFVGKEVHVGTGPGGGIRIQVESEFYDAPDKIPDPEIRGLIKAAIQEWEKS
jgi:hypothetical protein